MLLKVQVLPCDVIVRSAVCVDGATNSPTEDGHCCVLGAKAAVAAAAACAVVTSSTHSPSAALHCPDTAPVPPAFPIAFCLSKPLHNNVTCYITGSGPDPQGQARCCGLPEGLAQLGCS
jgi:hypothetical protein